MATIGVDCNLIPEVYAFLEPDTHTISYIVKDPDSSHCAIIDSVMGIDYASGKLNYDHADTVIEFIRLRSWTLDWLIETHIHADHLSAAPYIQNHLGGKIGIGIYTIEVQTVFGKIFNEGTEFQRDGSQFDKLFEDGQGYSIGTMMATAIHTPGHTPACMTHIVGNSAFVGDTLFMPDGGTARADFPGGDARQLYRSIGKILSLPTQMRLFICHDYGPGGRAIQWQTTVGEQIAHNIHVHNGVTEDEFVALRQQRDVTLGVPRLILPSIQVNMRAGRMPLADTNGNVYLKVPLTGLRSI